MKIMKTIDLQEIKRILEENRKIFKERLKNGPQETYPNGSFITERSDLARSYDQGQRNELLLTQAKEQLTEVEAALQRLENGTYGKCLDCDQPINPERLRILPSATLCIRCQQQQEQSV
jgi:DnaK suppressor protein